MSETNWNNYPENKPKTCNVLKYSDEHILKVRSEEGDGWDNEFAEYREKCTDEPAGWYNRNAELIQEDRIISFCKIPE